MSSADIIDVPVRTAGIRLGQFLKLANVVEDGVQAREEIADGAATVNGEVETRRGRQLDFDDVVGFHDMTLRVAREDEDF
ncbi:RNA-binding S4 domain-containing protein [Pseudoglutamicibacter cumminsii]|uniref:RNA-binding protein n=1 Tax=Pseudoglutamicibacter cumminsii TaxID=156979 RepID=A0ABX5L696_9MICC|nr:RNA-binding S4 domain-containing protein [Pseudoglutamicibacter cumminsii]MBM7796430.1 ribosome-associated protein [Pseudoglutamicibacter cumminsii]MCT1686629.1 RNA-binding S4 domain-containing protein [Pseudoglutamicibacter cumminsii]MDK7082824.1 RNA-binding S4 domain-containing protein [Pseudoglutamicibacter cumminsii]MDZ3746057.1 RNA-binding S4 domain-containing protein [Pseudoglutamicibacter cumminsii]PWI27626.1 RNA-binding protein [Pseudoglutamicibacter cumminsii]